MVLEYLPEPTLLNLSIFFTLVILEGALSLDNAAVLAALTRRLPLEQRRKALLYGLVGAYVFRVLAVLFVVFILQYPVLKLIGGGYLIFLAAKHFIQHHQDPLTRAPPKLPYLNVFWSTVVVVELADIAFALDQILVAVAFTEEVGLIIMAAFAAIVLLRVFAFYMGRLMDWFPELEHIAYVAVAYVGVKLCLQYLAPGAVEHYLPKSISVMITLGLFIIPIGVKLLRDRRRGPTRVEIEADEFAPAGRD